MLGSSIDPPAHVPAHFERNATILLQLGGALWTICYALLARAGLRTRSYGMPMFALANNLAYDTVFGLALAADPLERAGFATFAMIQLGLVCALAAHGAREWAHAPAVQRHLRPIFALMVAGCALAHWSAARWWVAAGVGAHRGKTLGRRAGAGADTMELCFWSALVCQAYLSAASLAQLLVRGHTGGVGWAIWATRTLGTGIGMYAYYAYRWWHWPEIHDYVANPLAIVLVLVGFLSDAVYPVVFAHVRRTETVLSDGRRIPARAFTQVATELISLRDKN